MMTIIQRPSPNLIRGPFRKEAFVIHEEQGTSHGTQLEFANGTTKLSATYEITAGGLVYQFVPDADMACANGNLREPDLAVPVIAACWKSGLNPNKPTISIELEGHHADGVWETIPWLNPRTHQVEQCQRIRPGTIHHPFVPTEAQYQALVALLRLKGPALGIPLDRAHVLGHYQFDNVTRNYCPGPGFPWDRLMADLAGPVNAR
jgi:N-acetylmuramoyl-L-alanine amidase